MAQTYGFKPGQSTPSSQYGYDGAGNLVGDPFKGQAIEYNHLHLPKKINGSTALTTSDVEITRV